MISMARSLENTKVKLDLLTDIDLLLMIKMLSEVEYIMHIYRCINMIKLITNTSTVIRKVKNHNILSIGM